MGYIPIEDRGIIGNLHTAAGLVPLEALLQSARHCLGLRELDKEHVLEVRLWE